MRGRIGSLALGLALVASSAFAAESRSSPVQDRQVVEHAVAVTLSPPVAFAVYRVVDTSVVLRVSLVSHSPMAYVERRGVGWRKPAHAGRQPVSVANVFLNRLRIHDSTNTYRRLNMRSTSQAIDAVVDTARIRVASARHVTGTG
jgi:hypothetical protein